MLNNGPIHGTAQQASARPVDLPPLVTATASHPPIAQTTEATSYNLVQQRTSRLDHAIDNIARLRPQSRKNSAGSLSLSSNSSRLPSAADPGYNMTASSAAHGGGSAGIRGSMHSERSVASAQNGHGPSPVTSHAMGMPHSNGSHSTYPVYGAGGANNVGGPIYAARHGMDPPGPQHQRRPSQGQSHQNQPGQEQDWADRGASRRIEHTVVNGVNTKIVVKKGVKDFTFGKTLGEGSYSTVVLATDRQTLKEYAIKVLDKRHIIKEKKVKYVNIEKNTLFRLGDHPGVVRLYYTFQDEASLYFVLDLATNGELLGVLKKLTTFDEECSRYYCAQILDAIDYMHGKGVIHRDLKPENVLLDDKMRVKIADFGTAKLLDTDEGVNGSGNSELEGMEQSDRANSFVGTAEYVSPELLTEKSTCKSSDLWALGCILYQLLAGKPPFKASNEYQTFQKIVHLDYTFPPAFPETAADLVRQLLVANPAERLTIPQVRQHAFFQQTDWSTLWKIKAPKLKPYRPAPATTFEQQQQNMPQKSVQLPNHSGTRLDFAHQQAHHSAVQAPFSVAPTSAHYDHEPAPVSAVSQKTSPVSTGLQFSAPQTQRAIPGTANTSTAPPAVSTRPRSRIESSPSELDLQFSQILQLPNERILRLGQVSVLTSSSGEAPRKFNKMLSRRKNRMLMVTSTGRCLYIEVSGESRRIKGEIALSGSTTVTRLADEVGKSFLLETPQKSYLFDDPAMRSYEWVESIKAANGRVAMRLAQQSSQGSAAAAAAAMASHPPRSAAGSTHSTASFKGPESVKAKRRSRIGF